MCSRITATAADRLRREDGIVLVAVILISFLLMALLVLTLRTGEQADRSSVRDRNFDIALSMAEAGVHEAIAKIEASNGSYEGNFNGSTSHGTYEVVVTRETGRYVITAIGDTGSTQFGRTRTVRVTLGPPASFAYALFSNTSIELKNLDTVDGDVWANDSVLVDQNNLVTGSVTAAGSWVEMKQNSTVQGDVWTGGYHTGDGWSIKLAGGAEIAGNARASVSDPSTTCPDGSNYRITMANTAKALGDAVACGEITGGTVGGDKIHHHYSPAAIPKSMPAFTFNPNNYDPDTYHVFWSVAEFQDWLDDNGSALEGTFYVTEAEPGQKDSPPHTTPRRINLTGVTIAGDTTIVTNAPVFTNGIDDDTGGEQVFVLVSHYEPPTGSSCSVDHHTSECAVHIMNNFDPSCATAVLIYADNGPVAVKNNAEMCGAVYAESILVKNNQELTYDPRVANLLGFGDHTYAIARWEEVS